MLSLCGRACAIKILFDGKSEEFFFFFFLLFFFFVGFFFFFFFFFFFLFFFFFFFCCCFCFLFFFATRLIYIAMLIIYAPFIDVISTDVNAFRPGRKTLGFKWLMVAWWMRPLKSNGLTHLCLAFCKKRDIGKQCKQIRRHGGVWSGSVLFTLNTGNSITHGKNKN